jgi:hypothetical protein
MQIFKSLSWKKWILSYDVIARKGRRFDSRTIGFLSKRPIFCVGRQYLYAAEKSIIFWKQHDISNIAYVIMSLFEERIFKILNIGSYID